MASLLARRSILVSATHRSTMPTPVSLNFTRGPIFCSGRLFSTWKISREEVAKHNKREDCWIIIHGKVYDITSWVDLHPGRDAILRKKGGDSTELFERKGHSYNARELLQKFEIGEVEESQRQGRYTLEEQ